MEHREASASLMKRARRVYEIARWQTAILQAWPVPVAAWLAMRLGATSHHVLALAIPLAAAAIAMVWQGGTLGRAVAPGLAAGIAPLILPGLAMDCAMACSASCVMWCTFSCFGGGLVAGGLVGFRAARYGAGWWRFGLAAAAVAAATGAMGCFVGGATGVVGMLAGVALGAAPVIALVPRRI
jgi:hypothetical protein